jgi:hypothetical protein
MSIPPSPTSAHPILHTVYPGPCNFLYYCISWSLYFPLYTVYPGPYIVLYILYIPVPVLSSVYCASRSLYFPLYTVYSGPFIFLCIYIVYPVLCIFLCTV